MQVSKEILLTWVSNLDHGDKAKIKEETGLSYSTISKALEGEATQAVILKINGFFKKKAQELKQGLA